MAWKRTAGDFWSGLAGSVVNERRSTVNARVPALADSILACGLDKLCSSTVWTRRTRGILYLVERSQWIDWVSRFSVDRAGQRDSRR